MDTENVRKSPYHGAWVIVLLQVGVPAAVFALLYAAMNSKTVGRGGEEAYVTAVFFSGLVGVLFEAMLLISGVFSDSFEAVKTRVKDFASDVGISVRMAFSCYAESMKSDGVVFLIYFSLAAATCGWLIYGAKICVAFLSANGGI